MKKVRMLRVRTHANLIPAVRSERRSRNTASLEQRAQISARKAWISQAPAGPERPSQCLRLPSYRREYGAVLKNLGSGIRLPGFKSWLKHIANEVTLRIFTYRSAQYFVIFTVKDGWKSKQECMQNIELRPWHVVYRFYLPLSLTTISSVASTNTYLLAYDSGSLRL